MTEKLNKSGYFPSDRHLLIHLCTNEPKTADTEFVFKSTCGKQVKFDLLGLFQPFQLLHPTKGVANYSKVCSMFDMLSGFNKQMYDKQHKTNFTTELSINHMQPSSINRSINRLVVGSGFSVDHVQTTNEPLQSLIVLVWTQVQFCLLIRLKGLNLREKRSKVQNKLDVKIP